MKLYVKILSLILCAATLTGIFSGCGGVSENSEYITKGEFFALFIEENNMYSRVYSAKEIAANETYELEAKVMKEWELIDDEQAKSLDNAVTKEIVAQSCVRFMSFRQTCSEDIKDIKKCHDQQAIIDAVGMGIFDLENGYFNALKKMSYEDCREAIKRMDNVVRETTFDKQLEIVYQEGVETLDPEVVLDITYADADENENNALVAENMSVKASDSKTIALDDGNQLEFSTMTTSKNQCMWVTISIIEYHKNPEKYKVGKILKYEPFSNNNSPVGTVKASTDLPFAGKISKVLKNAGKVTLTLTECEIQEVINTKDYGINEEITTYKFQVNGEPEKDSNINEGFDIQKTSSGTGIQVSFKHTFSLKDKVYKKQDWCNPSAKPSIDIIATVENFTLTSKNLGLLLDGSAKEAELRLDFDTTIEFNAEAGGLRYSPANNGNSGFLSALGNSRWTGAGAGGSEMIKIGNVKLYIPDTPLYVEIALYLFIQMDGSIKVVIQQDNSLLCSLKKNDLPSVDNVSSDPYLANAEIKANITTGIKTVLSFNLFNFKIIDGEVKAAFDLDAQANIYYSDNEKETAAKNVYVTSNEIEEHGDTFKYCINTDLSFEISGTFLTTNSILGDFLINDLKMKTPSITFRWLLKSKHYEDGEFVDACSRYNSAVVEVNSDGEIRVSSYKENLQVDGTASVAITSLPLTDNKINNNGGIKIKTGNKKVATAKLNEETKTVQITAVGEGSTEITLQIKKNNSKKYYTQKISVTVYGNEMSFLPYDNSQFWNSKEAVKFC